MKKAFSLIILLLLAGLVALTSCGTRVLIENQQPAGGQTSATTSHTPETPALSPAAAATPSPPVSSATAAPTPTETRTPPTAATAAGKPTIVVESSEIVPIPDNLFKDLNAALDNLIAGINSLDAPAEDALAFS